MRITALAIITIISLGTGIQGFALGNEMVVSAQATEPLFSKNLFNVELLYAYVQPGARTAVAVVNFTKVSNMTLPDDSGVAEVYTVHIFSEGNLVSDNPKIGRIIGSGIASGEYLLDLGNDGGFSATTNVGLDTFTIRYSPIDYPILIEPISVSLIRLGWITSQGNNSEIHFSSQETTKNVELTKYQEGFLYNTLLSQEQLSRLDPFKPLSSYTTTPLPSPSSQETITPSPSAIGEISEASAFTNVLVISFIVAIGLVSASLYFYKRRRLQSCHSALAKN